ncbi:exonuclease SbcCD subunit D [Bacteroides sp. 224]|uniref:exonuclease SbcCD subunit D n=1 Tax=Bacteroides sp. 224 TaxID=2302936 RepID=UPI0013D15B3A|nr:exonuclease SbcCD subunit D [Bacteroides sp. 224]NDV65126.1 exonuclease SbcCD subunit D [Bacteroides sp. 224]
MIRILHTADWHLGQTFFGYDRTIEHEHFLNWLTEEIKTKEADVLIIAGDVFDVANPSAASQRMFYRFVRRVTNENPHLQIITIAGNHDSASRLEAPLPLLQEMNTYVKGVIKKQEGVIDYDDLIVELKNRSGEVEALCLTVPFLRQGDYPAVETEGGNTYTEGVKAFYKELTTLALEQKREGQALVAVGHLQATGSEIAEKDHSERTIIGGLEAVSPEAFSSSIAYTALGHIHKAQRVSGRECIRYAGSPLSMSFAEKYYKHGVVLITLQDGELNSIEKLAYEPLVTLLSVPSDKPESSVQVIEQLHALPEYKENEQAPYLEVKVLLTEPEPLLRRQIEDSLAGKHARLARIVSVYKQSDGHAMEEEVLTVGLQEMNPLQIAKQTFEKMYLTEMPDELLELFQEATLSLYNEK